MANVIAKANMKFRTIRKEGHKELSSELRTIEMDPVEIDEDEWQMRQLVAWIVLVWGWDIL